MAASFRLASLNSNPPSIFRDEAEKGYNAFCLLKTGSALELVEAHGGGYLRPHKLPLFIQVFRSHTSALYQYLCIPFVAIGGLNPWSLRLPAALVGLLTVVALFFLAKAMRGYTYGLLAAALLSISPWHIVFSRWALQGILVPLFVTLGLFFFVQGIHKRALNLVLGAACFALAFYAYAGTRFFLLLFLGLLLVIFFHDLKRRAAALLVSAALLLLIIVPMLHYFSQLETGRRFYENSVFSAPGNALWLLLTHWGYYYGPSFLFFRGDHLARHSLPGLGVLHYFELPFLLLGLWVLLKRREKLDLLLLAWFLIYPVGGVLMREGNPHALRALVGIPVLTLINAQGILYFLQRLTLNRLSAKVVVTLFLIAVLFCTLLLCHRLFRVYPYWSAASWQYGIAPALNSLDEKGVEPERIYISAQILFAPYLVLFYRQVEPQRVVERGMAGIGYGFLAPGSRLDTLPPGSHLVLLPGELPGPAEAVIYYPVREGVAKIPALMIYRI